LILGFTGTRLGLTPRQRAALPSVLATKARRAEELRREREESADEFGPHFFRRLLEKAR